MSSHTTSYVQLQLEPVVIDGHGPLLSREIQPKLGMGRATHHSISRVMSIVLHGLALDCSLGSIYPREVDKTLLGTSRAA